MNELWADIEGYEGLYQVSNLGRVKALNYYNSNREKILKKTIVKKIGIYTVHLRKDGIDKKVHVCDLVARHFLKNDNEFLDRVTHINDKLDDSVNNLKYVSGSELYFNARKKKSENENIRKLYDDIPKWKKLAKENGIKWDTAYERIRIGWEIEEACTIPTKREEQTLKKMLYKYNGKWYSIKQISEHTGINEKTIRNRLHKKWSIEEVFEVPLGKRWGL